MYTTNPDWCMASERQRVTSVTGSASHQCRSQHCNQTSMFSPHSAQKRRLVSRSAELCNELSDFFTCLQESRSKAGSYFVLLGKSLSAYRVISPSPPKCSSPVGSGSSPHSGWTVLPCKEARAMFPFLCSWLHCFPMVAVSSSLFC